VVAHVYVLTSTKAHRLFWRLNRVGIDFRIEILRICRKSMRPCPNATGHCAHHDDHKCSMGHYQSSARSSTEATLCNLLSKLELSNPVSGGPIPLVHEKCEASIPIGAGQTLFHVCVPQFVMRKPKAWTCELKDVCSFSESNTIE
jgi:hypothetical protein